MLFHSDEHAQLFDDIGELGFATTSPNQLLLQVTEHRFESIREGGAHLGWSKAIALANALRDRAPEVHDKLWAVSPQDVGAHSANPCHVLFYTGDVPVDARRWARVLADDARIDVELATDRLLLLLLGGGAPSDPNQLIQELRRTLHITLEQAHGTPVRLSPGPAEEHLRADLCDLRQPYLAPSRSVPLQQAVGARAAAIVTLYPPGRPILTPGQRIDAHHVDILTEAAEIGGTVTGIPRGENARLPILADDVTPTPLLPPEHIGGRTIQTFHSGDITSRQLTDYSDLFREVFCNWPFNQFAFHVDNPVTPLSPLEFLLGRSPNKTDYVDLAAIDAITLQAKWRRWMDPQLTHQLLKGRCAHDGYLIFVTDDAIGRLEGFLHARAASLRTFFDTEEWRNPILFSGYRQPNLMADEDAFFDKAGYHFGLAPDDWIFYISAVALRPSSRGRDSLFFRAVRSLQRAISPEHAALPFLAEIPDDGPARDIEIATSERLIHGFLGNGHDVVFSSTMSYVLNHFKGDDDREFSQTVRRYVALKRRAYIPHPQDNAKVEIRERNGIGRGVFATDVIEAGETIAVFSGERYKTTSATSLPDVMVDHAIQVSETEFVHGKDGLAELCNHSCAPNAGIRNLTEIFAARRIEAGEEICWDYRCSEDSDWILDPCRCGATSCTGVIKVFSSLPRDRKSDYLARGLVSDWIIGKLNLPTTNHDGTDDEEVP